MLFLLLFSKFTYRITKFIYPLFAVSAGSNVLEGRQVVQERFGCFAHMGHSPENWTKEGATFLMK